MSERHLQTVRDEQIRKHNKSEQARGTHSLLNIKK